MAGLHALANHVVEVTTKYAKHTKAGTETASFPNHCFLCYWGCAEMADEESGKTEYDKVYQRNTYPNPPEV